jgi:hypothetical protein
LRLAQPGGPTDRVSVLFLFFPEDRNRIQLLKCDFIYNLDDGQSPRKQFYKLVQGFPKYHAEPNGPNPPLKLYLFPL